MQARKCQGLRTCRRTSRELRPDLYLHNFQSKGEVRSETKGIYKKRKKGRKKERKKLHTCPAYRRIMIQVGPAFVHIVKSKRL